jgi:hypothetical protein
MHYIVLPSFHIGSARTHARTHLHLLDNIYCCTIKIKINKNRYYFILFILFFISLCPCLFVCLFVCLCFLVFFFCFFFAFLVPTNLRPMSIFISFSIL